MSVADLLWFQSDDGLEKNNGIGKVEQTFLFSASVSKHASPLREPVDTNVVTPSRHSSLRRASGRRLQERRWSEAIRPSQQMAERELERQHSPVARQRTSSTRFPHTWISMLQRSVPSVIHFSRVRRLIRSFAHYHRQPFLTRGATFGDRSLAARAASDRCLTTFFLTAFFDRMVREKKKNKKTNFPRFHNI